MKNFNANSNSQVFTQIRNFNANFMRLNRVQRGHQAAPGKRYEDSMHLLLEASILILRATSVTNYRSVVNTNYLKLNNHGDHGYGLNTDTILNATFPIVAIL